jgi:hypothetical protein
LPRVPGPITQGAIGRGGGGEAASGVKTGGQLSLPLLALHLRLPTPRMACAVQKLRSHRSHQGTWQQ